MREKQLQEKHAREAAEQEYDRRMDIIMEIDRLKDLNRREDEEAMKRAKKEVEDILMYQALKDAELKNMVATYFDYFCLCQFVSIQNSH